MSLDAHARPPAYMRLLFKKWQKLPLHDIAEATDVVNPSNPDSHSQSHLIASHIGVDTLTYDALDKFVADCPQRSEHCSLISPIKYEVKAVPGLFIYPSLLGPAVQIELLNRLLHRDLSNPVHQTNMHLHYHVPYSDDASSFFGEDQDKTLVPRDAQVHKPITVKQMLERKLRWMTLGGQYDWTAKVYPTGPSPEFPRDVAAFLRAVFPDVDAQAAILNLYTPGDTLSVHRDVSEECDRGLISISIGCDAIFIIGTDDEEQSAVIRLRSGDAVLMSGKSRFAWHAVPRVLPHTCPERLQNWPDCEPDSHFQSWRGWMNNKRVNLNVRQMKVD